METEETTRQRRVPTRYSDTDRSRLVGEQADSGLTKKAFCAQHGINLGTFYGWCKRTERSSAPPAFAQVELAPSAPAALEVLFPNGVRVGVRHEGKREELVALVRGIAGAPEVPKC